MNAIFSGLSAFGFLILTCLQANAAVWTAQYNWNSRAEAYYSQFIRNLPLDFFVNNPTWGGMSTDCADAAYALRIIFAYENSLPVSFKGGRLTNTSSAFDHIQDPVKRVRAFIARVADDTNTRSLVNDSYPIKINRRSVIPGKLFLHPQGDQNTPLTYRAGHVYIISNVAENGIIRYVSSTVPASIRPLNPRNGVIFTPFETGGGYRAWKWPDSDEQPDYSEEQFTIGKWKPNAFYDGQAWYHWQNAIVARVRTRTATAKEEFNAKLENLQIVVRNRAEAVTKGWNYYRANYAMGQCMSEDDYDAHSTPTRDVKVQVELQHFEIAAARYAGAPKGSKKLQTFYKQIKFQVMPDLTINVNNLRQAFLDGKTALTISEPEHTPAVRWGVETQGQWPCPERRKAYRGHENYE